MKLNNKKRITNPIYFELLKLKLINNNNLIKVSNKTRDKKISVYQDKISKIIFLEKYLRKTNYYEKIKDQKKIYSLKDKEKNISKIKTTKGIVKSTNLNDDLRRFKQFNKHVFKKDILDFGCGLGKFLNYSKNAKSLNAVEIRKNCINFIKDNFKRINIKENIKNFKIKFDIITMFHTLEHIPKQVEILKILKNKIKKNGTIIIEVPHANDFLLNIDSMKEFKNFTFWSEHLILHTEQSLKKILQKTGFKKIKIEFFQRYGLDNHLGWVIHKKPSGHSYFKKFISANNNENYKQKLIKLKMSDTLIAIASN